jgi:exodeoxyribonuclease VII small subunit
MADATEPSFEEALTQIEQIVASLERGEPALSCALAHYEAGVKLLRHCYRLLEEAEQSVSLLTGVDEQGNPLKGPFDAVATLGDSPIAGEPTPMAQGPDRISGRPIPPDGRTETSDPPF